jgi:hypothetical protein
VMFIMVMMITIASLVVVMNWLFVLLASQRTTQLADTLALSAVAGILDDGLLEDDPVVDTATNQPDDEAEVTTLVGDLRILNNAATATRLQLDGADITIVFGHVTDVTMPITGANFDTAPLAGTLFNAVRIDVLRDPAGANPLELMIRSLGAPDAVKVTSAAYGLMDSRVVGYRPTANVASPVVPIAIESDAWFIDRPAGASDAVDPNGRFELTVTLLSNGGVGTANGALISIDETAPFDISLIAGQIMNGITQADLDVGTDVFGPVAMMTAATQTSPAMADTDDIIMELNSLVDNRRVFPVYDTFMDPVELVGFVGARILTASDPTAGADPTITLVIEPEFIVHFTAETDPAADENLYLHKIRLVR